MGFMLLIGQWVRAMAQLAGIIPNGQKGPLGHPMGVFVKNFFYYNPRQRRMFIFKALCMVSIKEKV